MGPTGPDDPLSEIDSLRNQLSKLSEASRLVSESLDLDVVLKEVIDNARSLTGARYGALLTYQVSGSIQNFVTSGISPREIELLNTMPRGLGLLGYMNEIKEPLRLSDISSHPRSVGFPENHPPMKTFMGMPIRYRDEHVGNIYLTEKDGGQEFTIADQDVLVMFASQAGAAIFNARRYQEEQQARANLEALLTLSPVGMLVVDAATKKVESVNREAERITGVGSGVSLDEFRNRATYSLPDGRELPIERHPLQAALRGGDDIRAEELVFEAPGGRKTNCLVNAKAIRSDQGDLVSAVGILLDITPLEDLKRQRAEFLSRVSHELRTPLSAIKGSTSTILRYPHPLNPAETRQFLRVIDEQSDHMRNMINDLVDMTQIEAGTLTVDPEPTEVADLLVLAREVHLQEGPPNSRDVRLQFPDGLPRVMADKMRIHQVLDMLLTRLSASPSESTLARISASSSEGYVEFTVDTESAGSATVGLGQHMRGLPGVEKQYTGRRNVRDDLAIALCQGIVEAHGGRLTLREREPGAGSRFTFTIPAAEDATHLAGQDHTVAAIDLGVEGEMARVLFVGEDRETARYVRDALARAGFTGVFTCVPQESAHLVEARKPHVVVIEPELPRDEGFELLQDVGRISDAPVIFLAGHGWDQHIGRAFEYGAFDYIAKPFTSTELVARVKVALRRQKAPDWKRAGSFSLGELSIDYAERKVTVGGRNVHLTATEYRLLVELSTSSGKVLTHDKLMRRVWGSLNSGDSRVVRTVIKDLRRKLGDDAARPSYILTETGVGYRMPKPPMS